MKLTLVSVTFRGKRYSYFTLLPVDPDGHVRVDYQKVIDNVPGVFLGDTVTLT
jgi:hypothetical protein